jgi:hypothetical protein
MSLRYFAPPFEASAQSGNVLGQHADRAVEGASAPVLRRHAEAPSLLITQAAPRGCAQIYDSVVAFIYTEAGGAWFFAS